MRLYTPFLCAKCQGNRIWRSSFIAVFVSVQKEEENKKKKMKKLTQFLKSNISGTLEVISLKFGMWSADVGGRVHSKNRLVSARRNRATEVQKLRFRSSCQYTQGCCAPASWAAQHITVCLDIYKALPACLIESVLNILYSLSLNRFRAPQLLDCLLKWQQENHLFNSYTTSRSHSS